jgi:periplasmic copper chaperone A
MDFDSRHGTKRRNLQPSVDRYVQFCIAHRRVPGTVASECQGRALVVLAGQWFKRDNAPLGIRATVGGAAYQAARSPFAVPSFGQIGSVMSYLSLRLFVACVAACTLAPSVQAAPPAAIFLAADDGVMVHEAWARASAGAATTGAAYVTLMGGSQPDSLIGVSTPIATSAEAHETVNDNGIMKMRAVTAVPIPAGKMVTFSPGGYHIMLMGLKHPLVAGQSFPLTLTFEHSAPATVDVKIQAVGHAAPMGGHDDMKM